jgi:diacylglycerol kinase family enzyme
VIAVFVNPHSRANRRNPRIAARFQTILGGQGQVLAPRSLDELETSAAELRRQNPSVVAVHGGDGTLHKTLTAMVKVWGDAPLPPLAMLCGGTMNVVASSLGIRERPEALLRAIVENERAGRRPETLRRRCIQVGDQYGFVFGNGLIANFLTEYYGPAGYGHARAIWLMVRVFGSALVFGPFARRVFRRFEGTVTVDGQTLEWGQFVGVGAATVREVGLGFKLNHRADDDPDRFGVLAIHAGPLALLGDLVAVHGGRGIAPTRAFSTIASTLDIDPKDSRMAYTIDGDLYKAAGRLRVTLGPVVEFIKPERGLIRRGGRDTMEVHP